ncbi:hypothetical protein [Psychrilyobacter sp.]|uniref:hypothetical protein n=1 Tax=Psychrilyobacter sp. TaxID=2586924 RepID=UPI00301A92C7
MATVKVTLKKEQCVEGEIIGLESNCFWSVENRIFNVICKEDIFDKYKTKFFFLAKKYKCKKISLNFETKTFTRHSKKELLINRIREPLMLKTKNKKTKSWGL